jgi:hypothetical protein
MLVPRNDKGRELVVGLKHSVADPDPGSGTFLTPGSGIGFFRIPDPTIIFESLKPIFSWVKK